MPLQLTAAQLSRLQKNLEGKGVRMSLCRKPKARTLQALAACAQELAKTHGIFKPFDPKSATDILEKALQDLKLPFEREVRFALVAGRAFRFDFANKPLKIAVEIEGGVHSGGRHTRGKGFIEDTVKYNLAQEMGWIVLRYDTQTVKRLGCTPQIQRVFERRKGQTDGRT